MARIINLYEVHSGGSEVHRFNSKREALADFAWGVRTIQKWSKSDQRGMKVELYLNDKLIKRKSF